MTAAVITVAWSHIPSLVPDSNAYIAIAEGRLNEVHKPFANRLLHPYLVRASAALAGMSIDQAFLVTAIVSLAVLAVTILILVSWRDWRGFLLLPFITPPLFVLFQDYYLSDLFHAALLALFLLAYGRSLIWAAVLIAALQLTRESAILLAGVAIVAAALARDYRAAGVFTTTTIASVGVVHIISSRALPNIHAMNEGLYLILKIPFNAAKNLSGLTVWTNTSDFCHPWVAFALPQIQALGQLRAFGICPWSPAAPLTTAVVLLTSFGIAPTILAVALFREREAAVAELPTSFKVALVYGSLSFLVAPLLGASVGRLAAYGWPAFWIVTPVLLSWRMVDTARLAFFPLVHFAVAWAPWCLPAAAMSPIPTLTLAAWGHWYAAKRLIRAVVPVAQQCT